MADILQHFPMKFPEWKSLYFFIQSSLIDFFSKIPIENKSTLNAVTN